MWAGLHRKGLPWLRLHTVAKRGVVCFDRSPALFREPRDDHHIGMLPSLLRLLVAALLYLSTPLHLALAETREGGHASDVQTVPRGMPMLAP